MPLKNLPLASLKKPSKDEPAILFSEIQKNAIRFCLSNKNILGFPDFYPLVLKGTSI